MDQDGLTQPMWSYPVLSALSWRVCAELMRRHPASLDLRIHQYYPGISGHGLISLSPGRPRSDKSTVTFGLGGGENGAISVRAPKGRQKSVGMVHRLLEADVQLDVVLRSIESATNWNAGKKVPTTRSTLVARVIARFLERYMLAPTPFRTTSAYIDNGNDLDCVCRWLDFGDRELCRKATALHAEGRLDSAGIRPLQRWWLLHRVVGQHTGPVTSLQPTDDGVRPPAAVLFDFATARAIPVFSKKKERNLWDDYTNNGHHLKELLLWVEEATEAP